MKYGDVTLGQMEAAINKLGGYENWLRFLRDEMVVRGEQVAEAQYVLDLNYDAYESAEKMFAALLASGEYNWKNRDVAFEHFPIERRTGLWRVTCELAHPNKTHSAEYARGYIQGRGCQSPQIEYGLAFGATHKEVQRQFPIVVACPPWVGRRGLEILPVLGGLAGGRLLDLSVVGRDWFPADRWLAVRTEVPLAS